MTTIYITRWALTEGILVLDLEEEAHDLRVRDDGALELDRMRWDEDTRCVDVAGSVFIPKGQWATTVEDAHEQVAICAADVPVKNARRMKVLEQRARRAARIASGELKVGMKPASKGQAWTSWGMS